MIASRSLMRLFGVALSVLLAATAPAPAAEEPKAGEQPADPQKEAEEREALAEKVRPLIEKYNEQVKAGKWQEALAVADEIEKALPAKLRFQVALMRGELYTTKKDFEAAYKQFAAVSNANADNGELQNYIAWQICTDKRLEKRDIELAAKCAERANAATKGENAAILDTLARVRFMQGKKDEAVKLQEQAVAKAEDDNLKPELQKTLDSLRKGELPPVEQPEQWQN